MKIISYTSLAVALTITHLTFTQVLLNSTWGVPVIIGQTASNNEPSAAMDRAGNTFVAWGTDNAVLVSRFDARTNVWSSPEILADIVNEVLLGIYVRANNKNQAIVAWVILTDNEQQILTIELYSPITNTWSSIPTLTLDHEDTNIIQLTFDDSTNIMVLKQTIVYHNHETYAILYENSAGKWTDSFFLYQAPFIPGSRPLDVSAFAPNGNGLVLYGSSIQAFSYDHTKPWPNGWAGPVSIFDGISISNSVAVDNEGNGLAVCGINDTIQSSQYDSNLKTWTSPYTLFQSPSLPNPNIETAMNGNGHAMTAWVIQTGSNTQKVITAQFDALKGWSTNYELTPDFLITHFISSGQIQVFIDDQK